MDDQAPKIKKLLDRFKWIENYEQLLMPIVLTESQFQRLCNNIDSYLLKRRFAFEKVTSFKFFRITKTKKVDQGGNLFDLYHVEFNYTIEGSLEVKQVTLNTW